MFASLRVRSRVLSVVYVAVRSSGTRFEQGIRGDDRLRSVKIKGLTFDRPLAAMVRSRRADDPVISAFVRSLRRHFSK